MKCEIITIGDEILIGQIVDTNSAWIAQELNLKGITVKQISSVSDDAEHIKAALSEAEKRTDLIIITGGLGPTKDDITKKTLCDYFNSEFVLHEPTLEHIKNLFSRYNRPVTDVQIQQAMVLKTAKVFLNEAGTAPCMWIEKNNKVFVSLPGVPYEMKHIMEKHVLNAICNYFKTPFIMHKTILTQGMGESIIAEKLKDWEEHLEDNIKLAYLPSIGIVRLRISGTGNNKTELENLLEKKTNELSEILKKIIFGYDHDSLEHVIGKIFKEKKYTLSIAESCTGGYVSQMLTKIKGASDYFKGGCITYSIQSKIEELNVPKKVIEEFSVYSNETVELMSIGVKNKFNTDFGLAISGVADEEDDGETKSGTIFIGVSGRNKNYTKMIKLGDNRERNIIRASLSSLMFLRNIFIEENTDF